MSGRDEVVLRVAIFEKTIARAVMVAKRPEKEQAGMAREFDSKRSSGLISPKSSFQRWPQIAQ